LMCLHFVFSNFSHIPFRKMLIKSTKHRSIPPMAVLTVLLLLVVVMAKDSLGDLQRFLRKNENFKFELSEKEKKALDLDVFHRFLANDNLAFSLVPTPSNAPSKRTQDTVEPTFLSVTPAPAPTPNPTLTMPILTHEPTTEQVTPAPIPTVPPEATQAPVTPKPTPFAAPTTNLDPTSVPILTTEPTTERVTPVPIPTVPETTQAPVTPEPTPLPVTTIPETSLAPTTNLDPTSAQTTIPPSPTSTILPAPTLNPVSTLPPTPDLSLLEDLARESTRIAFMNEFSPTRAQSLYFRPGAVCNKATFESGTDNVLACRGFTKMDQSSRPSCWITFDGSNDAADWNSNFDIWTIVDTSELAQNGPISVHQGFYDEFSNGKSAISGLIFEVCFGNGSLSADDLEFMVFLGHSKGGANTIIAAYHITSGVNPQIAFPADRTHIVVAGCPRAFESPNVGDFDAPEDPDKRSFASVVIYQTILLPTQSTYTVGSGLFFENYDVIYDLVLDLPPGYHHLTKEMDFAPQTQRKQIVHRTFRDCEERHFLGGCGRHGQPRDTGFFVGTEDWRAYGFQKCHNADFDCTPFPNTATHGIDQYIEWSKKAEETEWPKDPKLPAE
jgi:hypothetical protein